MRERAPTGGSLQHMRLQQPIARSKQVPSAAAWVHLCGFTLPRPVQTRTRQVGSNSQYYVGFWGKYIIVYAGIIYVTGISSDC